MFGQYRTEEEGITGRNGVEEEGMEYEIADMRDVIPNRDSTKDSKFKLTYTDRCPKIWVFG